MKITLEWLNLQNACEEGYKWFTAQEETDAIKVLEKLMAEDRFFWANWTICRLFNYKQRVQYAVFAAEQVIDIYEKKHPDNKRPRKAIEAAKKCIDNPSKENKAAAAYAVYADAAADAAAYAVYADAAAYAAYAADAAAYAADAARKNMRIKILEYGISLLKEEE